MGTITVQKKEIKAISENQEEMKSTMYEIKNTLEGITSRLDEAEDSVRTLEEKVEKKHPERARKGKETHSE